MSQGDAIGALQREEARAKFLASAGLADANVIALAPDASFRCYFRVRRGDDSMLLMDAPPEKENPARFATIDDHLRRLGLLAPEILARDLDTGFLLLQDFGDETFTRLLATGHSAEPLYRLAVDTLVALDRHGDATDIEVPPYDLDALLAEAALLPDWHHLLIHGRPIGAAARRAYLDIWRGAFASLPPPALTLVLRDYHVDNLMLVRSGDGARCGLLDFQDALIGPIAYDLASLLQDARRDIDERFEGEQIEYFLSRMPLLDRANFFAWYRMLAAQRHAKVLGIFSRLCLRDGKCHYLAHLPRVIGLLERAFSEPALRPLKEWMARHFPDRASYQPPTGQAGQES